VILYTACINITYSLQATNLSGSRMKIGSVYQIRAGSNSCSGCTLVVIPRCLPPQTHTGNTFSSPAAKVHESASLSIANAVADGCSIEVQVSVGLQNPNAGGEEVPAARSLLAQSIVTPRQKRQEAGIELCIFERNILQGVSFSQSLSFEEQSTINCRQSVLLLASSSPHHLAMLSLSNFPRHRQYGRNSVSLTNGTLSNTVEEGKVARSLLPCIIRV